MKSKLHETGYAVRGGAFLFPGQGAVGRNVPEDARVCVEEAARLLGVPFEDFTDPATTNTSRWQQVVTLCTGYARACRMEQEHGVAPAVVAGHSLGEITAYLVASALSFEDAVALVAARGDAMDAASSVEPGAMAAVRGMELQQLVKLCSARDRTVVANLNSDTELVVSGPTDAVRDLLRSLHPGVTARMIPVAGAFHSPLMKPAESALSAKLAQVEWRPPRCVIISSIDGALLTAGDDFATRLSNQMQGQVRWVDVMRTLGRLRPKVVLDVGPGSVLARLFQHQMKPEEREHGPRVLAAGDWTASTQESVAQRLRRTWIARAYLEARCAPGDATGHRAEALLALLSDLAERGLPTPKNALRARDLRDAVVSLKRGDQNSELMQEALEFEWISL